MKKATAHQIQPVCLNVKARSYHGLSCGSSDAEVVLCLHGWLDNAASFIPFFEALESEQDHLGKKFIAIDWPGHGLSDHRSDDAHYHFFDYIYDMLQLFEVHGWQKIAIIGHSMGGMIASAFAAAFPEKVRSLTLIDTLGFIYAHSNEATAILRQAMLSRLSTTPIIKTNQYKQEVRGINQRTFSKEAAIQARLNVSDLTKVHANLLISRSLIAQNGAYCWRSDPRLKTLSPYRLTLAQGQQLLTDIRCPVLLIYGTKGMDLTRLALTEFAPLIADFRSVELDGGHHVHMEQSAAFRAVLSDFYCPDV